MAAQCVCFEYGDVGWYVVSRYVRLLLIGKDGFVGCRVGRRAERVYGVCVVEDEAVSPSFSREISLC